MPARRGWTVIYELNGEVHWELSPELMRELIYLIGFRIANTPGATIGDQMLIELSNCRSALECELHRMRSAKKEPDLTGGIEL